MAEETTQPQSSTSSTPLTKPTNGTAPSDRQPLFSDGTLKSYPSLSRFKTVDDLGKSYGEAEKFIGGSVRIPDANTSEEDRNAFYTKLGRPESPDKYDIRVAEGAPLDEKLVGAFKGVAHSLGLNSEQAQKLTDWYSGQAAGIMEQQGTQRTAQIQQWESEVDRMWGWQKAKNDAIGARALMTMLEGNAEHPLAKMLDETGLGNHPALRQFFYELGMKQGEDRFVEGDQGPSEEDVTSARDEINAIRGDKNHAYWDARKPGYQEARARMRKLYDLIHAAGQA